MTDDDLIVFLENDQVARTNGWSTISIDPSSITASTITYTQLYQASYRYGYTYNYTNLYETEAFSKQTKKKTPSLKKKVLSNPLLTLTERSKLDESR